MKGKRIVVTTQGTYPISFVKRLFQNDQPIREGVRKTYERMISTSPFGTLGLIGNASKGISYQLGDISPYAGAAGMSLLRNGKFTIGKLKSSLLS